MTGTALAMALALALDRRFGWPDRAFQAIGHPVTWIGWLITRLDTFLNHQSWPRSLRILTGALTAALVIWLTWTVASLIAALLPSNLIGVILTGFLAAPLLASKSMIDHVRAVAVPLAADDTNSARSAVAMIVGRNPDKLDAPGISRAALESLGENTSDGIIAPLFWGLVAGLPGIATYKAINTLDSMIGYRTDRHEAFGKTAAILDDLVNWLPARLTGLGFALLSPTPAVSVNIMRRDAPLHRSPNAGWPEAGLAALLSVRLSGPRVYGEGMEDNPWVNAQAPDPDAEDLMRGIAGLERLLILTVSTCLALAFLGWLL